MRSLYCVRWLAVLLSLLIVGIPSCANAYSQRTDDSPLLAFISGTDSQIYLLRADGTGLQQITDDKLIKSNLQWSPDGRTLAFLGGRLHSKDLVVMNADGSKQTILAENVTYFVWSPDSKVLHYVIGKPFEYDSADANGIYRINVDGAHRLKLYDGAPQIFAWSPDRSRVAVGSDFMGHGFDVVVAGIMLEIIDTAVGERISVEADCYQCKAMVWSPDGTSLILQDNYVLHILNAEFKAILKIPAELSFPDYPADAYPTHLVREPHWQPRRSRFVYFDEGRLHLLIVSHDERMEIVRFFDFYPAALDWSSDGAYAAYAAFRTEGSDCEDNWWQQNHCLHNYWICHSETTRTSTQAFDCKPTQFFSPSFVAIDDEVPARPQWSPDGDFLAWATPRGIRMLNVPPLLDAQGSIIVPAGMSIGDRITLISPLPVYADNLAWQPLGNGMISPG